MGIFDDVGRFFEQRLEEFLRQNPQLELQALAEQLREQEKDTLRLILELQAQQKQLEVQILEIGRDIQRWHERSERARAAGRLDLAQAAREREAALLFQGNQRWGQMQGTRERIAQSKTLVAQIQQRQQEIRSQIERLKAQQQAADRASSDSRGWQQAAAAAESDRPFGGSGNPATDPLEAKFNDWETEQELDRLKRDLNR